MYVVLAIKFGVWNGEDGVLGLEQLFLLIWFVFFYMCDVFLLTETVTIQVIQHRAQHKFCVEQRGFNLSSQIIGEEELEMLYMQSNG